ncbi:MAG: hypothetical protein WC721_10790 [Victivallaceae bacterium]|jgi:hypothetical protein
MQNEKQKLERKIDIEIQKLVSLRNILKGSVNKVRNASGIEIHQLTYKGEKNITRTVYLRKEKLAETKKMILNYQKTKRIIDNLIELNIMLLKTID